MQNNAPRGAPARRAARIKQQHLRVAARGGVAVADGADLVSDARDGLSPRIDWLFPLFSSKRKDPIQIVFAIMHAFLCVVYEIERMDSGIVRTEYRFQK